MKFNIELPLNNTSFGQIGFGLLVEIFRKNLDVNIFPIGGVDLSAFNIPDGFVDWYNNNSKSAIGDFGKKLPLVRLWHIRDSDRLRFSSKSILFTAHEASELTKVERDICNTYDVTCVTSLYSQDVFFNGGVRSVKWVPNFFDACHFKKNNPKNKDGIIQWLLCGKMEKRKLTHEILSTWSAKYGGLDNHRLNCLITNKFLPPEIQQRSLDGLFKTGKPWNINLLDFQQKNNDVNNLFNFCDIDISGLSGAEGWNLPSFTSCSLGKQTIVLDGHSHRSWASKENSILVSPSGTRDLYDGVFFNKGDYFNQGDMCIFDPKDVFVAMDQAVYNVSNGIENSAGLELQEEFTVSKTLDSILDALN